MMNFAIFKTDNGEYLINLNNVTDISPSKKEGHTDIYFATAPDYWICVNESYEQVKNKIFSATTIVTKEY